MRILYAIFLTLILTATSIIHAYANEYERVCNEPASIPQLHKLSYAGLGIQKAKILRAANAFNAVAREKSILLAIASIETERMQIDYPKGDGKTGNAYNVSIYKMNIGMLKELDAGVNINLVNNSIEAATALLLKGLREWGEDKFLRYHRGGEGAFFGKINECDILNYISAIKRLAKTYRKDKNQLNPKTTDNIRYTIDIEPI
jgi:hypothetical protein